MRAHNANVQQQQRQQVVHGMSAARRGRMLQCLTRQTCIGCDKLRKDVYCDDVKNRMRNVLVKSAAERKEEEALNAAGDALQTHAPPPSAVPPRQKTGEEMQGDGTNMLVWEELLSSPEPEIFGPRARSASDAGVLRRKGHLKEQDRFIQFLLDMHQTHTSLEVMEKVDKWISEHRRDPRSSKLRRIVPDIGSFYTPLKMVEAFLEYDEFFALSRRQFVPPNFAEIRHILNIAQVHSSAQNLKLITFDADGTLYADGAHMKHDNDMIRLIISLMRLGVHVAIVTAAGYPQEPEKFEQRVEGLLVAFQMLDLPKQVVDRFHIMGGECNYLLRVADCAAGERRRLEFVLDSEWKSPCMMSWNDQDIENLLTSAESMLLDGAARLRMPVNVIRKERAVGVIPQGPTIYEVLEDLAIAVQTRLDSPLPFCAFNGGNDVFVDVGNKSLGLEALMSHLNFEPSQVLHVGDRFTDSGNDSATRDCCAILWVANPEETYFFIHLMLQDINKMKETIYIE